MGKCKGDVLGELELRLCKKKRYALGKLMEAMDSVRLQGVSKLSISKDCPRGMKKDIIEFCRDKGLEWEVIPIRA